MSSLAFEEYELMDDSKYRAYVAAIDKALKNFESTCEWADLISALGKLHKVVLSNVKYPVVPRRIIISKRLAQCLHPALPSGVHLKSLEIYDIIFKCMGTSRLSQELFIYSAGLFPLFGNAAMNVRSALLTIYESHFVPLGARLSPGLSGFLSGVLSGLEEGSDHHEKTSILLQTVAEGVGYAKFFGCLWECILNNSSVRYPAILHINSCFNKKYSTEDQLYILGTDIDIMVNAMCKALEDNSVMVQRVALDLVHVILPMHNTQLLRNDLTSIVASSLLVLLRRDMSLNRRLFTWLLGSELNLSILPSEHPIIKRLGSRSSTNELDDQSDDGKSATYFDTFSKQLLVNGYTILLKLAVGAREFPDLRPCKIISPLLDKPEISHQTLDAFFLDFLRYLYHVSEATKCAAYKSPNSSVRIKDISPQEKKGYRNATEKEKTLQDLNKTYLLVFAALQPHYPWRKLMSTLTASCLRTKERGPVSQIPTDCPVNHVGSEKFEVREICVLLKYMLELLPLDTKQQIHSASLPEVMFEITGLLATYVEYFSADELSDGLQVCKLILKKLIPVVVNPAAIDRADEPVRNNEVTPVEQRTLPDFVRRGSHTTGIIQIGIEATEGGQSSRNDLIRSKSASSVVSLDKISFLRSETASTVTSSDDETVRSSVSNSVINSPDSFEAEVSFFECSDRPFPQGSIAVSVSDCVSDKLSMTFLNKYVNDYLKFFLYYVQRRVVHQKSINFAEFEKLLYCRLCNDSHSADLKGLLTESIKSSKIGKNKMAEETGSNACKARTSVDFACLANHAKLAQLNETEIAVFKICCSILVDLSSMPTSAMSIQSSTPVHLAGKSLPTWLLCLLICITSGDQISPAFSQSAISTLLELVALAQSELSIWQMRSVQAEEEKCTVSLCMLPLLKPHHCNTLLNHTNIYQFIAIELWDHLDVNLKECHVTSTELLLQLHKLCMPKSPTDGLSIVEEELMKTLTSATDNSSTASSKAQGMERINAARNRIAISRWITLWQVSRSILRDSTEPLPSFNRCLFFMVERLRCPFALERSYSQNWLTESLYWGDLRRILDPILIFLLNPETRRVSVQHVVIEKLSSAELQADCQIDAGEALESQIYAISSTGGEVIYHISKGLRNQATNGSPSNNAIVTCAGLSKEANKYVTKRAYVTDYEVPDYREPSGANSMFLMVNPFTDHPWIEYSDLTKIGQSLNLGAAARNAEAIKSELSRTAPKKKEKVRPEDVVKALLREIIDAAVAQSLERVDREMSTASSDTASFKDTTLHPLHSHMLLYMQLIDSEQCLYGLNLLKNILEAAPKLLILTLASTAVAPNQSHQSLLVLLARHRKSVFGEGFEGGSVSDQIGQFRSMMYLQVVIAVCLYFIRSYYPQQPHLHVEESHLQKNRELQVVAAEVMRNLVTQLTALVADSPRGFSPFIKDLLNKCKVQKCVLHCLLATAHAMKESHGGEGQETYGFTQDVLEYNFSIDSDSQNASQEQPYLFCLMDLTLALIKLEDVLVQSKSDSGVKEFVKNSRPHELTSFRYVVGLPIPSQPMFLCSLLLALKQKNLRQFHTSWLHLFTSALPHMKQSLSENCLKIVSVLCQILEELSTERDIPSGAPLDYTLYVLSALMNILHFCLLDTNSSSVTSAVTSTVNLQASSSQHAGNVWSNLFHVFSPSGEILEATADTSSSDPVVCARKNVLSHLPRVVSALLRLWLSDSVDGSTSVGSRHSVRQRIIEMLSPICHHHTTYLLAALSVVWQGMGTEETLLGSSPLHHRVYKCSLWRSTPQQASLVELMAAMRILPLHTVVENVREVFKHPPQIEGMPQKFPLEVSLLQLFFLYVKETASANQLSMCWGPLLTLVREGLVNLPPLAILILLATFNEFVQRAPTTQGKKEIKEQQDVAAKLLEAVNNIAGSRLESTTWLRKNLHVRSDSVDGEYATSTPKDNSSISVAALSVLAELLAPMLDVLYSSEEKERVVPLLVNTMSNVIPYLRYHKYSNMAAFHSSSHLLSSLSGYQYTVRAWRNSVFELLLDSSTFRMLPDTLGYWIVIVDNMCNHDKTVFKELLSKMSISQSGSLNLFSSKESEYENCALLLKRISFVIFCSETDQYFKQIPDIQERLTEVTRLGQIVPNLVAQVLLCFKVLLLRISPRGMTSLWPIVITELVQVFLTMEQELSTDSEQFKVKSSNRAHIRQMSTLDSRWVTGAHNGLQARNSPAWLSLYLAACKLLDVMIALPASHLPQFQMYRWAFVGHMLPAGAAEKRMPKPGPSHLMESCEFTPHVTRIAKLMAAKASKSKPISKLDLTYSHKPGTPLLTMNSINTLMDLHPFMYTLTVSSQITVAPDTPAAHRAVFQEVNNKPNGALSQKTALGPMESVVAKDFIEPLNL